VRAAGVGEDGAHDRGVLHGGDDAQPAATAGAGQDIEIEHAAHQRGPSPLTQGAGGTGGGGSRSDFGAVLGAIARTAARLCVAP
jgi:hypothetical protein